MNACFLDQYISADDADIDLTGGFALFGAGRAATSVLNYFRSCGIVPFCFIDNNPMKIGKCIDGIPVLSKTDPAIKDLVVIATPRGFQTQAAFLDGIFKCKQFVTFDRYFHLHNADKIYRLYNDVFVDEESQNTLRNISLANISGDNKYYIDIYTKNQYYGIPDFMRNGNDVLVDIGAFVGDSLERFIWAQPEFETIYAFEPGVKQYLALQKRIRRLKEEWGLSDEQITAVNCAIGDKRGTSGIGKSSGLSNFSLSNTEHDEKTNVVSIDDYFKNKPVSFLKCDIEGAEIPMLKGAKEVLSDQKPKLAICTYHNASDLLEIIDLISDVRPYANMALRHHSYNFTESVLYCWN